MNKSYVFFLALILTGCNLGHKEVRYTEMAAPPKFYLKGDEIVIRTENSIEYPSFTIYEILPAYDEGEKVILIKAHEGMDREPKNEFKINVRNFKVDSLSAWKIFWVDPDNKKTLCTLEKE